MTWIITYQTDEESETGVDTDDDLIAVPGEQGIFYKIHYKNAVEEYNAKVRGCVKKQTLSPRLLHITKKCLPEEGKAICHAGESQS